ncbi:hypothetical protein Bca4012_069927 [Brassica carinata]|uniref:Gamma-interferon-inducible lysosomal thiol reductase n=1 Tax=Brassica carinata TaxID=52824 RepID=A0A8X7U623_BRACI|nr:hypothetical protein Bca52824_062140 [Brassica carinata]
MFCFEASTLRFTDICVLFKSSFHLLQLQLQYAAETSALEPPHKYVPWVVVDGQPLYEDYENFISYICKAYKGNKVPGACAKYSSIGILKVNRFPLVCWKGVNTMWDLLEPIKTYVTGLL